MAARSGTTRSRAREACATAAAGGPDAATAVDAVVALARDAAALLRDAKCGAACDALTASVCSGGVSVARAAAARAVATRAAAGAVCARACGDAAASASVGVVANLSPIAYLAVAAKGNELSEEQVRRAANELYAQLSARSHGQSVWLGDAAPPTEILSSWGGEARVAYAAIVTFSGRRLSFYVRGSEMDAIKLRSIQGSRVTIEAIRVAPLLE